MGGADGLAQYIQVRHRPALTVHRKQTGQGNFNFGLLGQTAAVDRIRRDLSLGVVVGKAGIQRVRVVGIGHQIPEGQPVPAPDVAALPEAGNAAVVKKSLAVFPGGDGEPGGIHRVRSQSHGGKIVPVVPGVGILGQGGPIGELVAPGAILPVGPCQGGQIPVPGGIQQVVAAKEPDALRPRCRRTGHNSLLLPDSEGGVAEINLHLGLQGRFQQHRGLDIRVPAVRLSP